MQDDARIQSLIERLGNLMRAGARASGGGLEPVHREILGYLSVCNRYSDTPAGVTDYLGATKGTTSQSIGVLERKGFLKKRPDKEDGRVVHLVLTAVGRRMTGDGTVPEAFAEALLDMGPGEKETLARLLSKILTGLQRRNGGRTFGVCRTCRFFGENALPGSHQCGLTLEPLSDGDSFKICREHETAA
ncbi:MAG: winged helix-turn-helix transcriptional regulator [Candidatus Dadabacteria bacterium]|nr:MAG: winged helix-turn-helix transcriptional regulator [Candidatus Dadabacteria bacterium]MCL4244807.1 MarR family winged helix-turn-helix transcriptional regulator [Candidatus Dadabacteria bacterium]